MSSINKVILIGNLGKDPEISYTPAELAVARFSIATSDTWKDKTTGDKNSKTEWHRVVAFGKLAEICGQYLTKGKQVYIEGRLQTSSYEKDGEKRYSTDIIANEMRMLGGKVEAIQQQKTKPDSKNTSSFNNANNDDLPF
jgi:single-strand DNA-binding protein